jgi:uncharacterized protein (DUF2225 family)
LKLAEKEISDVIGSSKAKKNVRILQYKLVCAYSSCPFHAFCKPFFSIKKKGALVALFQEKKRFCHQGISLPSGALDYLQSAISYYFSILIYLSYAKHLGTGTKKTQVGLKWRWCKGFAHIGVLKY